MTRAVTITNTSNWDNEDWQLEVEGLPYHLNDGDLRLTVGSSLTLHPSGDEMVIRLKRRQDREPKPFVAGRAQYLPKVDTCLEHPRSKHTIPFDVWREKTAI